MFGTANQLLSAIALAIATTYIIKRTKKIYSFVTLIPFIFMITTTTTAGIMNIKDNYLPMRNATGYINVFLTAIILILAFIITISSLKIWIKEATN
jgi:carbon starvation protein